MCFTCKEIICTKCLINSELCEELEIRDTEIRSEDFILFNWKTGKILLKEKKTTETFKVH